eukprot:Sspe_Gene.89886::Locus_61559_Transcript_1_1_Confidence_1.000_Length_1617::g.89886::m.89886
MGEDLYHFPWRICLAGGWLDQPWVSSLHPGAVLVVNVHPHEMFKTRSGLATSTRTYGIKLWGTAKGGRPPDEDPEQLARWLFNVENPIDCKYVSGSQDCLGLMLPGVSRLYYEGGYWPTKIDRINDASTSRWLEKVLYFVPLPSRPPGYDPLKVKNLTKENAATIARGADLAWEGIKEKDAKKLGRGLSTTMEGWAALLPETVPRPKSEGWLRPYRDEPHLGCLFTGAGGGFLMVVSEVETPVLAKNAFKLRVKNTPWLEARL